MAMSRMSWMLLVVVLALIVVVPGQDEEEAQNQHLATAPVQEHEQEIGRGGRAAHPVEQRHEEPVDPVVVVEEAPHHAAIGDEALEDPLRVKERNHRYSFWRQHHGHGKKVIHVAEERFQLDRHSRESVQREATQEQCVASNQHEFVSQEDGKPEADDSRLVEGETAEANKKRLSDVTKFKGFWSRTVPKFAVCTHGYDDLITSHFMKRGYWNDCLKLPSLAMAAVEVEALLGLAEEVVNQGMRGETPEETEVPAENQEGHQGGPVMHNVAGWKNEVTKEAQTEELKPAGEGEVPDSAQEIHHEKLRLKLLPRILDNLESPLVVDVGANIGTCSLLLASQAMEVIAFEALERNYLALNASVNLNGFQGLISLNYAAVVSEEDESDLRHAQHERHAAKGGSHPQFGTGRLKVRAEAKDKANYGDAVVRVVIDEPQEKVEKPEDELEHENPDKTAHRYVNDFAGGKPHSKLKGLSAVYLDYSIEAELQERDLFVLRRRQELEHHRNDRHGAEGHSQEEQGAAEEPAPARQRSHVNLLKIDCQGCELGALQGAKKMLHEGLIDVIQLEFDLKMLAAGRSFVPKQPRPAKKLKPTNEDERRVGMELLQYLVEYDYHIYDLSEAHRNYENHTLLDFPHCHEYYISKAKSKQVHASKEMVEKAVSVQAPVRTNAEMDKLIESVQENGATELIAISPKITQRFHCLERFLLPTQPIVLPENAQGSLKTERTHIASHSESLMKHGVIPGVPLDFKKDVKLVRRFRFSE